MPINARLFGSGIAATGEPATLIVDEDRIEVRAGELASSCRIVDLEVREVGFGPNSGYELAWRDHDGVRAVHVISAEAVEALKASPLVRSPQLESLLRTARRRSAGRSLGWLVVGAVVAFPLIAILLLISQTDRIAQVITREIPIDHEINLGNATFESLRPSLNLKDSGPAHEAVRALGSRLSAGSEYQYRFFLAENEAINAFALPGGIIVVHTGLIKATRSPEELAGVLAHEIQHVEQRHSLHAAVKELGLRAVWMWVTGDMGGTISGRAALELTLRKFSRDVEESADAGAFKALVEHGIDPRGMADFFSTMSQQRGSEIPQFLSTHPTDVERQRALRERIAQLQSRTFAPLRLGSWPPDMQ